MRQENAVAEAIRPAVVRSVFAEIVWRTDGCPLPLLNVGCPMEIKRCGKGLEQIDRRTLVAVTKRDPDREDVAALQVNLADESNVPVLCEAEFPIHFEMVHHVLPTVTGTDIADRTSRKTGVASHHQVEAGALRAKQFVLAHFRTISGV